MTDPVSEYLDQNRDVVFNRLYELLKAESVSTDPAYKPEMKKARSILTDRLSVFGFDHVQELEEGGHPALYADWLHAPGRPTILVYGHYDVQPPDPLDAWNSPPFEPTLREGRLYARGVSDDKAPLSIALETLAAFLKVDGQIPFNVKLLIEGEEELGSATLAQIIDRNKDLLIADAVLSADGARWRTDLPSVNVGSRGNGGLEFTITTASKDLHSGRFGGAVPNAAHVISRIIAELHSDTGEVNVAGFYDGIDEPSLELRNGIQNLPFDEDEFYRQMGSSPSEAGGYSTLERMWIRPTLEVNGLYSGYTGQGGKTVIPCTATAKITSRMVPGQNPDHVRDCIVAHLQKHCPAETMIDINLNRGWVAAYEVPSNHPLLLAAEKTVLETTGIKPERVRVGATLPLSDIINRGLGIDTVMFSFSTADEDFHAPNEFFRMSSLDEGFSAWVRIVRLIGKQTAHDYNRARNG